MATKAQICNFIKLIAPDVQKAYLMLGKVKPSVCIGMACVESGAGTSKLMASHHALWGQKVGTGKTATKYWKGDFFVAKTKEEYTVGQHTVIKDAFRSYDSNLQGALNYYELLNTSLYKKVQADADPATQMQQIKACGYMTSSTEVNSVLTYIKNYNLEQYDSVEALPVVPEAPKAADCPYAYPAITIRFTMQGNEVRWLQWQLNRHGSDLVVDGIFGNKTLESLKNFQRTHRDVYKRQLIVDGVAGSLTKYELKK
jgi:hypothetical protein